jgi:hypothetical protein
MAVLLGKKQKAPLPRDEEQLRLAAQIDKTIEQLRELAAEKHLYSVEKYDSEVQRLEKEAASLMRARDVQAKAPKKAAAPAPASKGGFASRHPQLVGALYGGGTVLFFSVAFFLLNAEQKPAPGAATGDAKYEAMLMLSAISISFGDSEQLLQAWELYMRQPIPRRRPPQLQRAIEWLEKSTSESQ